MSQRKRILIVGGSGFVGSNLAIQLSAHHQVICTYRNEFTRMPGIEYVQFNGLSDKDRSTHLAQKLEPDVVIYAAGSNDPVKAEKDPVLTQLVHLTGPNHMLIASDYVKAKFILVSSDWVFSGADGNYLESDTAIPAYGIGKSKLGAENYIRSRSLNHVIIRCAPLLGRGPLDHPSWLDLLREGEITGKHKTYSSNMFHNPVHIGELGKIILQVVESDIRNKTLHLGGLTKLSLLNLANRFLDDFGMNAEVQPTPQELEVSTQDFSLNSTQTLRLLKTEPLFLKQSFDLLK
jgi:dTDP-4-dehydrorhamnose reductase